MEHKTKIDSEGSAKVGIKFGANGAAKDLIRLESFPTLNGLQNLLSQYRLRRIFISLTHWAWLILFVQGIFLIACAWISFHFPLAANLFLAMAFSYALYLILPLRFFFLTQSKFFSKEPFAEELDQANPEAPDIFRSSLSLENHNFETLGYLESLYKNYLPKFYFPKPTLANKFHGLLFAFLALFFSVALIWTQEPKKFMTKVFLPLMVRSELPLLKFEIDPFHKNIGLEDTAQIRGQVFFAARNQKIFGYIRSGKNEFRLPLEYKEDGQFVFSYGPVQNDFTLYFAGENGESSLLKFFVQARPNLSQIQITIQPPLYTHLKPEILPPGVLRLPVFAGSRVEWKLQSNEKLKNLNFVFHQNDTATYPIETLESLGGGDLFTFQKTISQPMEYAFALENEDAIQSKETLLNPIEIIPDLVPEIEWILPVRDTLLTAEKSLPLAFKVKDDFGLSALKIHYRIRSQGKIKVEGIRDCKDWLKAMEAGKKFAET